MATRLVVVGHGMVGQRLLEELLQLAPDRFDITVFGAEPRPAYNRILLSPVVAGDAQLADLTLKPPAWFAQHGIALHTGSRVTTIDRGARRVLSADGAATPYDILVLATGSDAVRLPLPGAGLPGVTTFRDLADVDAMLHAAQSNGAAVVIGGGLLGLEAASGLRRRGMDVTVVHHLNTLMERQLDLGASEALRETLERQGLQFRMATPARAILGESRVTHLALADGSRLPADLVVMAVGIRPRIDLAQGSGLHCRAGIVVDDGLRTSDPHILALGECAEHRGRLYGLVAPLYEQAAVCARRLAGDDHAAYTGSLDSATLKVSGVAVASMGRASEDVGCETLLYRDPGMGLYRKLLLSNQRLAGAVLVGDTRDAAWFGQLIASGLPVEDLREGLIFGRDVAESLRGPPLDGPALPPHVPPAIPTAVSTLP